MFADGSHRQNWMLAKRPEITHQEVARGIRLYRDSSSKGAVPDRLLHSLQRSDFLFVQANAHWSAAPLEY